MNSTMKFVSLISGFTLCLVACGSSDSPAPTGKPGTAGAAGIAGAGTAGAGTAGAGTAGAGTAGAGTAGAGTAGAGTAGAGTAGAGTAGGSSCATATTPLISDFSGMGGLVTLGASNPYSGSDPGGTPKPMFDTASGALVMTFGSMATTTMYPYAFVGMGLNACTDASAYTGVKFMASGTLDTGCTIQFSVIDKEHIPTSNNGSCMAANCYPGGSMFTPAATATEVMLPFSGQALGGADPTVTKGVDPSQVVSIQWQLNPTATGCGGMVTIDDVTFY